MHHVGRVDWSFVDRPTARDRDVVRARAERAHRARAGCGPLRDRRRCARSARLDRPPPPLVRGDPVRPRGRAASSSSTATSIDSAAGDFALIPVGYSARAGQRWRRRRCAGTPPTPRSGWTRRAGRRDTFYEASTPDLASLAESAERPRFGRLTCAGSAITTARRRRPRRSASTGPPVAAAGRDGHGDPGLQRDLGEDADRPRLRGRAADRVHRRLRAGRLRRRSTTTRSRRRTSSSTARSRGCSTASRSRCGPGDVVFAGVGSTHGFFNTGDGRVRWIETQAPQPPARHAYRWVDAWKRYEEE